MTGRTLEVHCFGRLAGELTDAPGGLAFSYAQQWSDADHPPLSQSLPLDRSPAPGAAHAFFGGLLPEGQPRRQLERQLGVSEGNVFAMLAALAGDTAGAVSVFPPGGAAAEGSGGVEWLDDDDVGVLVDELPRRPMHADADGEWRLSLAGAQDKLPVVVGADGRIGLTRGRTPSTHILKTPIERLPGTVVNEAFCLAFARALGVSAATAVPRRVAGREFLLVERYDRRHLPGHEPLRLHQEDFCQALGVASERKYESEGGPGLGECFALIRSATRVPAAGLLGLLDLVAVNFLVGNHDAHGKNVSLLYAPGTAAASLAPAYDVLSTVAYASSHRMSRKMAMRLGGEYRPDYVQRRHVDRLLEESGLAVPAGRRRIAALARRAEATAALVRARLAAEGWDAPVLDEIEAIVERRAAQLVAIAG
jgi:serine/threonine-protein kinase HipA